MSHTPFPHISEFDCFLKTAAETREIRKLTWQRESTLRMLKKEHKALSAAVKALSAAVKKE